MNRRAGPGRSAAVGGDDRTGTARCHGSAGRRKPLSQSGAALACLLDPPGCLASLTWAIDTRGRVSNIGRGFDSGGGTFLQRGSPPPPPWRLLPESPPAASGLLDDRRPHFLSPPRLRAHLSFLRWPGRRLRKLPRLPSRGLLHPRSLRVSPPRRSGNRRNNRLGNLHCDPAINGEAPPARPRGKLSSQTARRLPSLRSTWRAANRPPLQ